MRSLCLSHMAWSLPFSSIFWASVRSLRLSISAKAVIRSGQDEGVGLIRVEELAADLREIGLVGALVHGEEEFLLEVEELLLLGVGVEGELRLVEGAARSASSIMRRRPLLRGWPSLTLKRRRPASSGLPAAKSSSASVIRRLQSRVCLRTSCSTSGLNWSY